MGGTLQHNRDLRDVVALQGEVAERIAQEIRTILTPEERAQLPVAAKLILKLARLILARYFWNKRTEEGMNKAISCFRQSIGKDPKSPLAYDGLADCWLSLDTVG